MRVTVRMFAGARDAVGAEHAEVDLPDGATVEQLRVAMHEQLPKLAKLLPNCMIALNEEYAADESPVPADATIACIPPLSGG
ncbi:MAG: MoaD/ThiS family protein [Planctomycetota bacterium]